MIQLTLTEAEALALRWALDRWALSGDVEQNCPFCYHHGHTILEKLGGSVELDDAMDGLWDHPIAKEWYEKYSQCESCNNSFPKDQLTDGLCEECFKEE